MSVYKTAKTGQFYHFDFKIDGHRFHGSTRSPNRKEAEKVEAAERDKAKALLKATKFVTGSMQIDHVAARYWNNTGQHHSGADTTSRDLARLVKHFGPAKLLTEIADADVARLVAWRRGQRAKGSTALVSPATVNRSTTEVLKKLFTFAKGEGVRFEREPAWKRHWLKEPVERVRELQDHEADAINAAMRADYAPLFDFVRATGLRQAECVGLKWSEV